MTTILTIAAYTWGILILSFILLGFWVTAKQGWRWLEEKGFIVEVGDDCEDFND